MESDEHQHSNRHIFSVPVDIERGLLCLEPTAPSRGDVRRLPLGIERADRNTVSDVLRHQHDD